MVYKNVPILLINGRLISNPYFKLCRPCRYLEYFLMSPQEFTTEFPSSVRLTTEVLATLPSSSKWLIYNIAYSMTCHGLGTLTAGLPDSLRG